MTTAEQSVPSAPAVTDRDTVAVEAVRAGARAPLHGAGRSAQATTDIRMDSHRQAGGHAGVLRIAGPSAPARSTTAAEERRFQQGLAILAEGAVRGIVGEYRNDLRVAEGHAACRHCGCIGRPA